MTKRVIVELVDFMRKNDSCDQESSPDEIYHLITLLKRGISMKFKHFSLNFINVETLRTETGYVYDVALSDDYNRLIISDKNVLKVFNRATSAETFDPRMFFKVTYSHAFHCMKLVKERGEEFIYATNGGDTIIKIKVSILMKRKAKLVWKSKKFSSVWGLDIFEDKLNVVQHHKPDILVLDREDGLFNLNSELPKLTKGYGIHFISDSEMLTSQSTHLELFEKQEDGKWKSLRKSSFEMRVWSIFYEELSELIYVSDTIGKQIHVMRFDDFSVVKSIGGFEMSYGIVIDKKSGLLYVCDGHSVIVFK